MLIEAVKSAIPLRAYFAEHGAEFVRDKARCLFHEDRTPSGSIYRGKDGYERFKCFGCGLDMDVIGAAQELYGLDFKGALRLLADRIGLKSTRTPAEARSAERARKELQQRERAFRAWERQKVDDISASLSNYRQKIARGFTEDELEAWAPVIQIFPELEYVYESVFCIRDESARRQMWEEELRVGIHIDAA